MPSKSKLSSLIVKELLAGQRPERVAEPFQPEHLFELPPQLPAGNNRWLPFSQIGEQHIRAFAKILVDNDPRIAKAFSKIEVADIVGRAFGAAFAGIDIDVDHTLIDEQVFTLVCQELAAAFSPPEGTEDLILGCWALTGAGTEDLRIGPVRFVERGLWLREMEATDRISATSARRIRARWERRSVPSRKSSVDNTRERGIVDSIGDTDTVCVVTTRGLTHKVAEEKGLLAGRIALTTLALHWQTPSKAIERMGLLHDGPLFRRVSVVTADRGVIRTATGFSGIKGHFITDEWCEMQKDSDWLWVPIGEALTEFVQPSQNPTRPSLMNALFVALWWFHEACRERSALIAIVKYWACLDALAGGKDEGGIRELIAARLGIGQDAALTKTGKTVKTAVREIYGARSLTIHGTNSLFGYDWMETRALSESIASICIRACCHWIYENAGSDDLAALRR